MRPRFETVHICHGMKKSLTAVIMLKVLEVDLKDGTKNNCILIFSGNVNVKLLRALRPGYRHCLVILYSNAQNVIIDTMSHKTEVAVVNDGDLKYIIRYCTDMGYTVLKTCVQEPTSLVFTLRLHTCVEAAKRLIGIQGGRILSPWHLYLKARSRQNRKKIL